MSRKIDRDRPLTEDDIAYLKTRSGGEGIIAENQRRFAHLGEEELQGLIARNTEDDEKEQAMIAALDDEDEEDSYHPDDVDEVAEMTIAQLRARLEEEGLNPKVTKKEMEAEGLSEKEVLSYRLLNHLDEKRRIAESGKKG